MFTLVMLAVTLFFIFYEAPAYHRYVNFRTKNMTQCCYTHKFSSNDGWYPRTNY